MKFFEKIAKKYIWPITREINEYLEKEYGAYKTVEDLLDVQYKEYKRRFVYDAMANFNIRDVVSDLNMRGITYNGEPVTIDVFNDIFEDTLSDLLDKAILNAPCTEKRTICSTVFSVTVKPKQTISYDVKYVLTSAKEDFNYDWIVPHGFIPSERIKN